MSVVFSREDLTDALWDEATPLLQKHWEEVAHYRDVPLEPDREYYAAMHTAGFVRCFTARRGSLLGYAIYFVKHHPHYKNTLFAAQDVIYLAPEIRGRPAFQFVAWCDQQLADDGVSVVAQHMKAKHPFGRLLEAQGYELMDLIYTKRLNVA